MKLDDIDIEELENAEFNEDSSDELFRVELIDETLETQLTIPIWYAKIVNSKLKWVKIQREDFDKIIELMKDGREWSIRYIQDAPNSSTFEFEHKIASLTHDWAYFIPTKLLSNSLLPPKRYNLLKSSTVFLQPEPVSLAPPPWIYLELTFIITP